MTSESLSQRPGGNLDSDGGSARREAVKGVPASREELTMIMMAPNSAGCVQIL